MATPMPQRHYQGEQGLQYHEGKRAVPSEALPWVCRLRAEKISPFVGTSDVVLEYGVGYGWNLAQLNCAKKTGVDVAESLAEAVRQQGIEFRTETHDLDQACVDVVICHHVLEHTPHPASTLSELARLLRPGGRLLVFVPFEKERRYRRFNASEPNHHLYSWNVQTIGNLIVEAGYSLRDIRLAKFRLDRFAAVWASRLRLGESGFRFIRRMGLLIAPEYEIRAVAEKSKDFELVG